jgi:hypothetical protein
MLNCQLVFGDNVTATAVQLRMLNDHPRSSQRTTLQSLNTTRLLLSLLSLLPSMQLFHQQQCDVMKSSGVLLRTLQRRRCTSALFCGFKN